MPRFFFHVMDGNALIDQEGTELADISHVRNEALSMAGEMLKFDGTAHWVGNTWHMSVANEEGRVVFSLRFEASERVE